MRYVGFRSSAHSTIPILLFEGKPNQSDYPPCVVVLLVPVDDD